MGIRLDPFQNNPKQNILISIDALIVYNHLLLVEHGRSLQFCAELLGD